MGPLARSVATLRIRGDDLDPEKVSALLQAQPTHAQRKGDVIPMKSGLTRTAMFGHWRLEASTKEPENVNQQIAELLSKLTQDLQVWHDLSQRFQMDLFCGWFMKESNEGVSISAASLSALGQRGIELGLDIYAPDTDAPNPALQPTASGGG